MNPISEDRADRPSPRATEDDVVALREARAFVQPAARSVLVRGADARRWLNDLVTAAVDELGQGQSVRSLILSPTGRIRADVHVLAANDAYVLVQASRQPDPVDRILEPYVLSSAVELSTAEVSPVLMPSELGWRAALEPPPGARQVDADAGERWRIESGVAVFPDDLDEASLPAEAGLDVPPVTEAGKGCFLGQESVARVRNLGHPTRLVMALEADGPVAVGQTVFGADREAGVITSSCERPDGSTALIARIRWEARGSDLKTASGDALRRR